MLARLRDAGLEEDTIVLFTSDHGELLGERGLWYKMAFFDAAARVPLIAWAPGRIAPSRVATPVSLLDLAPTLLELCDARTGGRARRPQPRARARRRRARSAPTSSPSTSPRACSAPAVMLVRGRHKHVWCAGDPPQLYDLKADPDELRNLASDGSASAAASWYAEVARRWDLDALREAVLHSQDERRLVARALGTGRRERWSYVPPPDAGLRGGPRRPLRGAAAAAPRRPDRGRP